MKLFKGTFCIRNFKSAAKEIGVSHTTLARIINGEKPNIDTLMAVSTWLGVPVTTFIEQPGNLQLSNQIVALFEANPKLAAVFSEALARIEVGAAEPSLIREIVDYASYRIQTTERKREGETN